MKQEDVRFTMCISKSLFERLSYVANFYGCPKSHTVRRMIEQHVTQFERRFGPIPLSRDTGAGGGVRH